MSRTSREIFILSESVLRTVTTTFSVLKNVAATRSVRRNLHTHEGTTHINGYAKNRKLEQQVSKYIETRF